MVNVMEQVKVKQLQARKSRSADDVAFYSTLLSEIVSVGKKQNRESTNDEAIDVVKKFLKGANEVIEHLEKIQTSPGQVENNEALAKYKLEKCLFEELLPKMATAEEIRNEIVSLKQNGASNVGAIMKGLKEKFGASLDGKLASSLAKE